MVLSSAAKTAILLLCMLERARSAFILRYIDELADSTSLCSDGSGIYFIGGWISLKTASKGLKVYTMTAPANNAALYMQDISISEPADNDCILTGVWAFVMKSYTQAAPGSCTKLHYYLNRESYFDVTSKTCPGSTYKFEDVFGTSSSNPTTLTKAGIKSDVRYWRSVYGYGSSLTAGTAFSFVYELASGLEGSFYSLKPSTFTEVLYKDTNSNTPYFLNALEGDRSLISILNSNDKWEKGVLLSTSSNKFIKKSISLLPYYRPLGLCFSLVVTVRISITTSDSTALVLVMDTGSTLNFTYQLLLNPNSGNPQISQSFNVDSQASDTFASTTVTPQAEYEFYVHLTFIAASSTKTAVRAHVSGAGMASKLQEAYSTSSFKFEKREFDLSVSMATGGSGLFIKDFLIGDAAMNWYGFDSGTSLIRIGSYRASHAVNIESSQILRCEKGMTFNPKTLACVACPSGCSECEGTASISFCTACSSGKYLDMKNGACLDSCTKTTGFFQSETEPKVCSDCLIQFCQSCSSLHTCEKYKTSTAAKLKEYSIDYPSKKITFRFDRLLNFSNPAAVLTFAFLDSNFTDSTTLAYRNALVSELTYEIKGKDLSVKFNSNNKINCNKTALKVKSSTVPILFYSSGSLSAFSGTFEVPFSNFLNQNISAWKNIAKYSNYVFRIFLILSIIIISQSLDSYFIILSYVYFLRMLNYSYPSDLNAFLDAFLDNLNWPLGNYIVYFIPGTTCSNLPLKVKQSYFDCISVRNIQLFLLLSFYLSLVKLVSMFLRCCILKSGSKGCFHNAIKTADNRLNKNYFIRFVSANIGFFSTRFAIVRTCRISAHFITQMSTNSLRCKSSSTSFSRFNGSVSVTKN